MVDFFLKLVSLLFLAFSLALIIRYGMMVASAWDNFLNNKRKNTFMGFQWYYRMPMAFGVWFDFYFFIVLGGKNYFRVNWWPLRTAAYISCLLFFAALFNRSDFYDYYSLAVVEDDGLLGYLNSGLSYWFFNVLNILYLGLFVTIIIESIRMHSWLSPVRIIIYSVFSGLMASLTLLSFILLIAATMIYLGLKLVWFIFFRRSRKRDDDGESTRSIIGKSYRSFKTELFEWENSRKSLTKKPAKKSAKVVRKRPKIKRSMHIKNNPEIRRFHPDQGQ